MIVSCVYYNIVGGHLCRDYVSEREDDYDMIGQVVVDNDNTYTFQKADHIRSMYNYLYWSMDGITLDDLDSLVNQIIKDYSSDY